MTTRDDDPFDILAAEYVLGTLRGAACERFEAQMRADPEIARRVREWESRLAPLTDGFAPAVPDGEAWSAIERRLFPARASGVTLAWWRRLALGFGATAAILLGFATWLVTGVERPQCYAVLTDERQLPAAVVFDRRNMQELVVLPVGPGLAGAPGSAQLWIVTGGVAKPVTLIDPERETRVPLDKPLAMAVMAADARLLVTLEPPGGSPTGTPGRRFAEGVVALPSVPSKS